MVQERATFKEFKYFKIFYLKKSYYRIETFSQTMFDIAYNLCILNLLQNALPSQTWNTF